MLDNIRNRRATGVPVSYTHLDVYKRQGKEQAVEVVEKVES